MTIHMIGNRPYTKPWVAASRDRSTGMPNARIATRIAAARPASPAMCALVFKTPRKTKTTSSGMIETIAVRNRLSPTASMSGWYGVAIEPPCT